MKRFIPLALFLMLESCTVPLTRRLQAHIGGEVVVRHKGQPKPPKGAAMVRVSIESRPRA